MKFKLISDSGQISSKLLFFSHSNDTKIHAKHVKNRYYGVSRQWGAAILLINYKITRQNHLWPDANIIDRCGHAAYTPHSVIFLIHSQKGAFR